MNFNEALTAMKTTYQIPGKETIFEHGESVKLHLLDLINLIQTGNSSLSWQGTENLAKLAPYLFDGETLSRYALYHDIGKSVVSHKDDCG